MTPSCHSQYYRMQSYTDRIAGSFQHSVRSIGTYGTRFQCNPDNHRWESHIEGNAQASPDLQGGIADGNRSGRSHALLRRIAVGLVVLYILIVYCSSIFSNVTPHDDHMYIAAACLLQDHEMYSDFSYLQMPYMPYVYNAIFRFTGFRHLLFSAKLFKLALGLSVLIVAHRLMLKLSGDRWMALGAVLMLIGNRTFRSTVTYARNYDLSLLLALASVLLFYRMVSIDRNRLPMALFIGLMVGLCIGTKLTYGLLPICILIAVYRYPDLGRDRGRIALLVLLGLLTGLLPALFVILRAGLDIGIYNNLGYHQINSHFISTTSEVSTLTLESKTEYLLSLLTTVLTNLLSMIPLVLLTGYAAWKRIGLLRKGSPAILPILLLANALLIYYVPTPSLGSYLYAFFAMSSILICTIWGMLKGPLRRWTRVLVWTVALLLVAANGRMDAKGFGITFHPSIWPSVESYRSAILLREAVEEELRHQPVATMYPILPLEAGLSIYPEFSCGDFTGRTGHLLTTAQQARFSVLSPLRYEELLSTSPPSMVIVNKSELPWERPLANWALSNGYAPTDLIEEYTVYIKQTDIVMNGEESETPSPCSTSVEA